VQVRGPDLPARFGYSLLKLAFIVPTLGDFRNCASPDARAESASIANLSRNGTNSMFKQVMLASSLSLMTCLAHAAEPRRIAIDVQGALVARDHFADLSVGSDFPGTLIRDDSLAQLETVQHELGFRYVPFFTMRSIPTPRSMASRSMTGAGSTTSTIAC